MKKAGKQLFYETYVSILPQLPRAVKPGAIVFTKYDKNPLSNPWLGRWRSHHAPPADTQ